MTTLLTNNLLTSLSTELLRVVKSTTSTKDIEASFTFRSQIHTIVDIKLDPKSNSSRVYIDTR